MWLCAPRSLTLEGEFPIQLRSVSVQEEVPKRRGLIPTLLVHIKNTILSASLYRHFLHDSSQSIKLSRNTHSSKSVQKMLASSEPKNMHRVRADEAARLKMQDSLRAAAEDMETPNDTMLRLFNGVSACCGTPYLLRAGFCASANAIVMTGSGSSHD